MHASIRFVRRGIVAVLAAFLLMGGTAVAGKMVTGADILDDSVTGADVLESSLGPVPAATNADQLGGSPASNFLTSGTAAGGALDGTYPNPGIADGAVGTADLAPGAVSAPKLLGGAAATNIWGNNRWAPVNATQRGYVHIRRDNVGRVEESGGFESISYPVPLAPEDKLAAHVIRDGDDPPAGCSGSFAEPDAAFGHLCIFYVPAYDGDTVHDVTFSSSPEARYGRNLRVDQGNDVGCFCAIADVVWAMTPPLNN